MKLLQQAVKDNSEPAELEAALNAAKLTPVQLDTFARFWKVQRAKVPLAPTVRTRSSLRLRSYTNGRARGPRSAPYCPRCSGG